MKTRISWLPRSLMVSLASPWQAGPWPGRFEMLDGWRGLAAVAVVLFHLGYGHGFNLGHYAVIIFFVISGYCISASSTVCLQKGMGFRHYMWRRIRRIYPPYFFALMFFFATRLAKAIAGQGGQFPTGVASWIQNLTLTQWLTLIAHPTSWAAANPTLVVAAFWSLNYEEQFYLVMGLLILFQTLMGTRLIWSICSLLVVSAVWNIWFPETSFGFFIEYWVQFGIGCLLYFRLCRVKSPSARLAIDGVLVLVAGVSIYMVWFANVRWTPGDRNVYLEWLVCALFALSLTLLRPLNGTFVRSKLGRLMMALGLITYSLYLVHQFNLHAAEWISGKILPSGAPAVANSALQLILLVGLGAAFWYACERPFLNRNLDARAKDTGAG